MSINSISLQYQQMSSTQGTVGNGGSVQLSYEDSVLTFTEADGDVYTFNAKSLTNKEIAELAKSVGAEVVKSKDKDSDDEDERDYDGEIGKLADEASAKEDQVKQLSDDVKNIYKTTLDEQEKITEDEYQRILQLVEDSVEQYKADKKAGKDVSPSDFQNALLAGVADSTYENDISKVFNNLKAADPKLQQMGRLLGEIGEITAQVKGLELEKAMAAMAEDAESMADFDSDDNIFTKDFDITDENLNLSLTEATSQTFALTTFSQIYTEKLAGHKEQYSMIADFRDLDDGIIEMYTEYAAKVAESIDQIVEEMLGKEEETEETEEAKTAKADPEEAEAEEEEQEEEYAIAA